MDVKSEQRVPHPGCITRAAPPSTWVSSSLCTTSASEATRCLLRSLRYWSPKTLETHMRLCVIPRNVVAGVSRSRQRHVSHIDTEGDSMRGVHTLWQHAATRPFSW